MEIKSKEKNTVSFDLVLKDKDIKDAETEVYKKNKKSLQVPGFRKGHVPRKLIENMYGKDVFLEDAINEILPEVYAKAVKELKLDVIDQPNIDIPEERKDGEDLIVNVKVDVKPEAKLGEYKGLEIEDPTMEVTDEVVMQEVENEREKNARIINVDDRAAQKGCFYQRTLQKPVTHFFRTKHLSGRNRVQAKQYAIRVRVTDYSATRQTGGPNLSGFR